jgi:uncharacterized membrane protein (Fun14 family)
MVDVTSALTGLVAQIGVGGILGFLVGYALKKVAKLLMVLAGILVMVLAYLGLRGVITVNFEALESLISSGISSGSWLVQVAVSILTAIPFAGSFLAGFLLGLRKG